MLEKSVQPSALTIGSTDSQLSGALANYLSLTRSKDEVRHAINAWCHDVARLGMLPERVLIEFKRILSELSLGQQSTDPDRRMAERCQVITMCIEEYFSAAWVAPSINKEHSC